VGSIKFYIEEFNKKRPALHYLKKYFNWLNLPSSKLQKTTNFNAYNLQQNLLNHFHEWMFFQATSGPKFTHS
jgi:hypothetical protein